MIKKVDITQLVTKDFLEERLDNFKVDLIKDVRVMIHEALIESIENAKIYHQRETEKYMKIIMDEWRDERRAFYDSLKEVKDIQEVHEGRISGLESAVV